MENYTIIASTNGYIAQRDIMFNGCTEKVLLSNLSEQEAHEKLIEFCREDYEFSIKIDSLEEFIKEFIISGHFDSIENEKNIDSYFESTKKRWLFLYEKRKEMFFRFDGPGVYENGNCIMNLYDNSYEYDSRYFSIQKQEEIEN